MKPFKGKVRVHHSPIPPDTGMHDLLSGVGDKMHLDVFTKGDVGHRHDMVDQEMRR